ncbi:MAG: ribosome silencing factor [Bacteroidota bacterium]
MKVNKSSAVTAQPFESVNDLIIDAIRDIKGKNITKIDLSKIDDAPARYFIICEGDSTVQVSSIAYNIQKRVRNEWGLRNDHMEGTKESKWILIDYFDTIVHVFYPETRSFYDIEGLWGDGHFVEYQNL